MTAATGPLPFFVYGTLRPGESNHAHFLHGRTAAEEPGRLLGAALYEGPGYPYAVPGEGEVVGELVTATPEAYGELLSALDLLEECRSPGHPRNLYEREVREVLRGDGRPVRAWVYVAAPRVARGLRASGTPIHGGDWLDRTGGTGSAGALSPRDRSVPRTP
ncbi:gamma-glutamylcyclotransferase family protein [Streptomyces sp. A5-4]|uniref:gamma-glutamylcyclotransferase family protein n=1 Tax=Streptomyces sp. A5-4 TaxID=3384771 RepID=UPI003DA85D0B